MTGRGSFLEIPLDPTQAKDNRNGLVKHIYGQVNHVYIRINADSSVGVFFCWLSVPCHDTHGVL